jgi:hypothetical protein
VLSTDDLYAVGGAIGARALGLDDTALGTIEVSLAHRSLAGVSPEHVVPALLAGCGGDDSGASPDSAAEQTAEAADSDTTVAADTTAAADDAAPDTGGEATDASSGVREVLPDACGLIDDATAAAAMGGAIDTKDSPQPPTDISARCEWTSGTRTISLLVRQGPNAESDFGNAAPDFVAVQMTEAQAQVRLGADDKDDNYRLVTLLAYDGQYYVSVILQGPSRDDVPALRAASNDLDNPPVAERARRCLQLIEASGIGMPYAGCPPTSARSVYPTNAAMCSQSTHTNVHDDLQSVAATALHHAPTPMPARSGGHQP